MTVGSNQAEIKARTLQEPKIPDDLKGAREKCMEIMQGYQKKRLDWYKSPPTLKEVLAKDIAMYAARGVESSQDLIEEAFRAKESSSEETVMGNTWQAMLATISKDTLDTGDLTTERGGVIWVCELKSQRNTTNSSSFPQELRAIRSRMGELTSRRRASNQEVRAAYCILRDNKPTDEEKVFNSSPYQNENKDLDGFKYRYITGKYFWHWLTGFDSELAVLMPLSDLNPELLKNIKEARERAISNMKMELKSKLEHYDLEDSIDGVIQLRDRHL